MYTVDLCLIAAALIGAIHGAWKGASWQLAGMGALAASLTLGRPLSAIIAPLLGEASTFRGFLAYAISYGVISLICFLLAWRVRHRLKEWELEKFDRHLGAGLGFVNGVAIWAVVTMFVVALVPDARAAVLQRPSGKVLGYSLDAMHGVLPAGVHEILHPLMHPNDPHAGSNEHGEHEHGEDEHTPAGDGHTDHDDDAGHNDGEALPPKPQPPGETPAPAPAPAPVPGHGD